MLSERIDDHGTVASSMAPSTHQAADVSARGAAGVLTLRGRLGLRLRRLRLACGGLRLRLRHRSRGRVWLAVERHNRPDGVLGHSDRLRRVLAHLWVK